MAISGVAPAGTGECVVSTIPPDLSGATLSELCESMGASEVPSGAPAGRSPEALASLYNAPHRRRARAETAKSMIGPGERPQEIYTPLVIREAILKVWPRIQMDPCSGPQSLLGAVESCYVPPSVIQTKSGKQKIVYIAGPDDRNGLKERWPDYTYCNPPFCELEAWMHKACKEAGENNPHTEIMQLVPVRPHRKWWRMLATCADRICWLNPVYFCGYKSGFPAPLAMLYWGDCPATFGWAFEALGDVREF